MARFHINPTTGGVGRCSATIAGNCPYGGEDGSANHYGNERQAIERSEELMAAQYGSRVFAGSTKQEKEKHQEVLKQVRSQVKIATKAELKKSAMQVLDESHQLKPEHVKSIETEEKTRKLVEYLSKQRQEKLVRDGVNGAAKSQMNAAAAEHHQGLVDFSQRQAEANARAQRLNYSEDEKELIRNSNFNRGLQAENDGYARIREEEASTSARDAQKKRDFHGTQKSIGEQSLAALTEDEKKLPPAERAEAVQAHAYRLEAEFMANQRRSAALAAKAEKAEAEAAAAPVPSTDRKGIFGKLLRS